MSDLQKFSSDLSPTSGPLAGHISMSLSPLEYRPYAGQGEGNGIGFTGVMATEGRIQTISQVGNTTSSRPLESAATMSSWLKPVLSSCLPAAAEYPQELLDRVVEEATDTGPLAAFVLERDQFGNRVVSLSASTILGRLSLEAKQTLGIRQASDMRSLGQRMLRRSSKPENVFTPVETESLVAAGALLGKLFDVH